MKILVVDELCYPQLGGIQVRFKALAEQWIKLGHTVHVTAIDHTGVQPPTEVINGVCYNRVIKDNSYYKNGRFGRKISTIFKYTFKLDPYFKQDWDIIIFCQFPMIPQLFYKLFYKKRAKTALDFVEYRNSSLWRVINRLIINAADHVVCISNYVKNRVSEYSAESLSVMPSFVDMSKAVSKTKANYVFLGRMEEHKHPELAIEAVIEYRKAYNKNIQLNMVGGGTLLESLKSTYAGLPFVTFYGSVTEEQKAEILAKGRILILPSEREGLPIVVIEAMSFGVPTITTDFMGNGTKYFVDELNIGKVALPNVSAIAGKINELEENYTEYVDRCNDIKGNYDIHLISKRYLEIFN